MGQLLLQDRRESVAPVAGDSGQARDQDRLAVDAGRDIRRGAVVPPAADLVAPRSAPNFGVQATSAGTMTPCEFSGAVGQRAGLGVVLR